MRVTFGPDTDTPLGGCVSVRKVGLLSDKNRTSRDASCPVAIPNYFNTIRVSADKMRTTVMVLSEMISQVYDRTSFSMYWFMCSVTFSCKCNCPAREEG
jgi:hypothetical protein